MNYERRIIETLISTRTKLDRGKSRSHIINLENDTPFHDEDIIIANLFLTLHKLLWPEKYSFTSIKDICTGSYTYADLELYARLIELLELGWGKHNYGEE